MRGFHAGVHSTWDLPVCPAIVLPRVLQHEGREIQQQTGEVLAHHGPLSRDDFPAEGQAMPHLYQVSLFVGLLVHLLAAVAADGASQTAQDTVTHCSAVHASLRLFCVYRPRCTEWARLLGGALQPSSSHNTR